MSASGYNGSVHDLVVIGLGLVGSAAARHAAVAGADVVAVGPAEPSDWSTHDGPFASHYDSGRITRRLDARWEWSELATRAIAEYPAIESASGVAFHHPVGLVFVRHDLEGLEALRSMARRQAITVTETTVGTSATDPPHLRLPTGWTAIAEGPPAGFIDPRRMIVAQLRAAEAAGATVRRDVAAALTAQDGAVRCTLAAGAVVEAERAIVATGSYANDLLAEPLAVAIRPEVVILGEVTENEARRVAAMPAAIYLIEDDEVEGVYTVPPTTYPDGRRHIKLGASRLDNGPLVGAESRHRWMSGDEAEALRPALQRVLVDLMPEVRFRSFAIKPCLLTDTATGLPYIDQLDDRIVVAVGGNGHAGKSADAIGALAASLALEGRWTDPTLPATAFAARTGRYDPPPGSRLRLHPR